MDWDRITKLLNGGLNVDQVFINSNWEFKFDKLWLRNQSNSNSIKINAGSVTSAVTYSFPPYNANDQIILANAPQTITGKTIDASQNTIIGVGAGSSASNKKTGLIQAPRNAQGGTASQGVLAGHVDRNVTVSGINFQDIDPPPGGTHWNYCTGGSSNTNAGIIYNTAFIRRDYDARIKCKIRLPTATSGHQLAFGFTEHPEIQPSESIIRNEDSAFLVGYRSTDSGYMVMRNAGTNANPTTPTFTDISSSVQKSATLYRTIEIQFRNQGAEVAVTIQNISTSPPYSASTIYTNTFNTNLPSITSSGTGGSIYMRPTILLTNRESVNHQLELFYLELESNF